MIYPPDQYSIIDGFTEATPENINTLLRVFKITPDPLADPKLSLPVVDPTGICPRPTTELNDTYFVTTVKSDGYRIDISGGYAVLKSVLFEFIGTTTLDIRSTLNSYLYSDSGDTAPSVEGSYEVVVAIKYDKTENDQDALIGLVTTDYYELNKDDLCVISILDVEVNSTNVIQQITESNIKIENDGGIIRQMLYTPDDFIVDGGWLSIEPS